MNLEDIPPTEVHREVKVRETERKSVIMTMANGNLESVIY
jgi:hypothetical protein